MDFKYKSQKEVNELTDEQVEVYAKEVKAHESALQVKAIELAVKESEKGFDAKLKAITDEKEEMQKHLDALDVKLQEKSVNMKSENTDFIVKAIKDNSKAILSVQKGGSVDIEIKAVADMDTANLTGDQPKDYNFDIVKFPSQKVNVADLVGSVNISGGTYTYTVEGAGEGAIETQTEGLYKSQRDYDFTTVDVTTDFIAGFARYSKKMRNNLSYITSAIPQLLRRDYFKAENSAFQLILAALATASTEVITGSTKTKMLMNEIAKLEDSDYDANGIVVRPSDYMDMLKAAKDDLESAVTYEGGMLRVAGIQVLKATWLPANKFYVGDWSRVNKINTEGLSLEFSDVEGTNFVKNNITARIESQTALAVEQPLAIIAGDFTAV